MKLLRALTALTISLTAVQSFTYASLFTTSSSSSNVTAGKGSSSFGSMQELEDLFFQPEFCSLALHAPNTNQKENFEDIAFVIPQPPTLEDLIEIVETEEDCERYDREGDYSIVREYFPRSGYCVPYLIEYSPLGRPEEWSRDKCPRNDGTAWDNGNHLVLFTKYAAMYKWLEDKNDENYQMIKYAWQITREKPKVHCDQYCWECQVEGGSTARFYTNPDDLHTKRTDRQTTTMESFSPNTGVVCSGEGFGWDPARHYTCTDQLEYHPISMAGSRQCGKQYAEKYLKLCVPNGVGLGQHLATQGIYEDEDRSNSDGDPSSFEYDPRCDILGD